jgi:arylsulfatase
MSDTQFDVVIAAYLIPDLAKNDFGGLVKLVADKQLEVEGIALVTVDADGKITVDETGDHLGRKGMKSGGWLGLVVGLLSPPLLAATVVGAAAGGLVGRFAKHKVESRPGEKMGAALPPAPPASSPSTTADRPTRSARRSSTQRRNRQRRSTAVAPNSSKPRSRRRKPAPRPGRYFLRYMDSSYTRCAPIGGSSVRERDGQRGGVGGADHRRENACGVGGRPLA